MPKKMKLNLEELNVQSFVTSLDDQEKHKLRGGATIEGEDITCYPGCRFIKVSAATCGPDGCEGFTDSCTDPDPECSAAGCV